MMRRLFWPLLTIISFFSVMAIWFCLSTMTVKLTDQIENILSDNNWISYDLEGRNLTLRGIAPDENSENNILIEAAQIPGIASVRDEIIVTLLKKPFKFILDKNANTIIIKGDFPVQFNRFEFLDSIDGIIIDQAENARGANEHFALWLDYARQQIKLLQSGTIILDDNLMTLDGIVTNEKTKENILKHALPIGLKIKNFTIKVE